LVFSTPIFLFGFLPIVLLLYYLCPGKFKNLCLLIASLLFYAWGETFYVAIMLVSIAANYLIGRGIHSAQIKHLRQRRIKVILFVGLVINIGILSIFKYANFLVENLNVVLANFDVAPIDLDPIHLPLGISFFTFQAISYLVDIYRGQTNPQKRITDLALYIAMFPQLIAGPIVRYQTVANQIAQRDHSVNLFAEGVTRFIYGLAKKVLIANTLGEVADHIFSLPTEELSLPLAWVGVLAYSFQIYFDFSGYSDMAIGLGKMFGFRFLENFNYPYVSQSLREFWRRWHISLSTWFRDYVYISLGGNRVGITRTYLNLSLVFFLTGVWHGASWNFIIWGMLHGLFLALEHAGFSNILARLWAPIRHIYVLLLVMIGWVFFRAETLADATSYLSAMFNIKQLGIAALEQFQINEIIAASIFALMLSCPVFPWFKKRYANTECATGLQFNILHALLTTLPLMLLFYLSILKIAASTYDPFIYFRF